METHPLYQHKAIKNFAPLTNEVVLAAFAEAQRMQSPFVSVEHLLIALAQEEGGIAYEVLAMYDVTADALRNALRHPITTIYPIQENVSEELIRTTHRAGDEVRRLNSPVLDTEHVLLGLLKLNHVGINMMLTICEVDAETLCVATLSFIKQMPPTIGRKPKPKNDEHTLYDYVLNALNELVNWLTTALNDLFRRKR